MHVIPPRATILIAISSALFLTSYVRSWRISLKNSLLVGVRKRDSIEFIRIDGGVDDGGAFGVAKPVFLPV